MAVIQGHPDPNYRNFAKGTTAGSPEQKGPQNEQSKREHLFTIYSTLSNKNLTKRKHSRKKHPKLDTNPIHIEQSQINTSTSSPNPTEFLNCSNALSPKGGSLYMILKQSHSAEITDGYFATNIIKKIKNKNNLDLNKVTIKKKRFEFIRNPRALVYIAKYKKHEIVLKEFVFSDSQFNDYVLSGFENELNILRLTNHQNIIKLYGSHLDISDKVLKMAFEFNKRGTVSELIYPIIPIQYNYNHILRMLFDIAKGMKYLHSINIIHRNLKPKHLLLFNNFHVKITGFEQATVVDYDFFDFADYKMFDSVGSDGYKAPELIQINADKGYTHTIDVFTFGTICYELFTQNHPFENEYLTNFEKLNNTHQNIIPRDCPRDLARLISNCWKFNPLKRISFAAILDVLNKMIM